MEVGKQVLAEGMLLCLFCYFCPKWWPLVLLAEADSGHHLHLAAGPPVGTRQIPCSETSPNPGPLSQLLGPNDSLLSPCRSCSWVKP